MIAAAESLPAESATKTILIVDDDRSVADTFARMLKLEGLIEVETGESVNHLEAMAQWAHLGRARAPFHLYVPAGSVDIAKRLASENHVNVAEIWSYHTIGDQTRFTLVHRGAAESRRSQEARSAAAPKPAATPPRAKTPARPERRAAQATRRSAAQAPRRAATRKGARPKAAARKTVRVQKRK